MTKLREHSIRFHAIAVVTAAALLRARDIYEFFAEAGIEEVGFNFDEAEGAHTISSLACHEDRHYEFLRETLSLAMEVNGQYRVRELANALRLIAIDLPTFS